jgi:hypothetical protein
VTYKFNDWLSVTGRTGRDWYQDHFRANYPVNNISPYNGGGLLDVAETHSETNSDFLITGTRPLFKDLTLTVNAGGNARVNDFNGSLGLVSRLVIPGVYTLANSDGSPTVGIGVSKKKVNSLYGLASFNYKEWLNIDVTGELDPGGQRHRSLSAQGRVLSRDVVGRTAHIHCAGPAAEREPQA